MGFKSSFYEFRNEKFLSNLRLKNEYKKRFFKIAENFCGYEAPKVIKSKFGKKLKQLLYGFKIKIL